MDLSNIPTEALEAELRRRKLLETTCLGEITISDNGQKAQFGLSTVPWPDGKYKIAIKCLQDLTSTPELDQEHASNNESQR